MAPIVVLWLLTVLLGQGEYEPKLAAVDLPSEFETCLVEKDATVTIADMNEAERMLRANEVDAVLYCAGEDGDELVVWAEGSDSTKTSASLRVATEALADMRADAADRMKADVESKRAELEDSRSAPSLRTSSCKPSKSAKKFWTGRMNSARRSTTCPMRSNSNWA